MKLETNTFISVILDQATLIAALNEHANQLEQMYLQVKAKLDKVKVEPQGN